MFLNHSDNFSPMNPDSVILEYARPIMEEDKKSTEGKSLLFSKFR